MSAAAPAVGLAVRPAVRPCARLAVGLAAWLGAGLAGAAGTLPAQDGVNASLLRAPAAAPTPGPVTAACARARAAVVHVFVEIAGDNTFRIERPGSGVVITGDGLVVTQLSLVAEALVPKAGQRLVVQLAGTPPTRLTATLVAHDAATGLALLQAQVPAGTTLASLPLAEAQPGDPVAVLAFPDGEDHVAFAGLAMAACGGVQFGAGDERRELGRERILLTDAAIQRRSHGGALLDERGALLGICNAERVRPETGEPTLAELRQPSFGFVLPAGAIRSAFPAAAAKVAAAPAAEPSAAARAVAAVADAIVSVRSDAGADAALGLDDPAASRRRPGIGSGVVVDGSGLILTNLHLVAGATTVTVTTRAGARLTAEVLRSDPKSNTALLRAAPPPGKPMAAVPWGRASDLKPGATVLAVGNPEGHALALGRGVLSARRGGALQTDAGIGNHTSGGALISLRGELVGLADAGPTDEIEVAFAQRGDRAKVETGLNLAPGSDALRELYRAELDRYAATPSAAVPALPAAAEPVARVVERAGGAVLNVYVEITTAAQELDDNPFAKPKSRTTVEGLGSGVVIDPSGLALTNWHVVDSATFASGEMRPDRVVRASLRDQRSFPVRVLSISREEDLALLQLVLPAGSTLPAIELGSAQQLAVGDAAIAIGNPHGHANSVTAGVVTAKNQAIRVRGRWAKLPHLLETDAAINGGNSGGPLLDLDGRLIGINSAGGSIRNVTGFAISVDHVRARLDSLLLTPEKLRSPYLGFTVTDQDGSVRVATVDRFGPAAAAGLETGDVLLALDGAPVRWSGGFALQVLATAGAGPVRLDLERAGTRLTKAVTALPAAAFMLWRQTQLVASELSPEQDAALVRDAAVAFYRAFSGDPTAAPATIPATLVRLDRVHPERTGAELRPGDLLLGVQLRESGASGDVDRLLRFERVADLTRCFQEHATYEGTTFTTWIWRQGSVQRLELAAKRLLP